MKKTNLLINMAAATIMGLMAPETQAAVIYDIIDMTADVSNSTTLWSGTTHDSLFNDTATYDPSNPTPTTFGTNWNGPPPNNIVHGSNAHVDSWEYDANSNYTLAAGQTLRVDVWGRDFHASAGDFKIELLNADRTAVLDTISNASVDDSGLDPFASFTFTGWSGGDEIGGIRFTDNQAAGNFINLAEARLVAIAVPEPSSTALLGLGGLALVLRRKRS